MGPKPFFSLQMLRPPWMDGSGASDRAPSTPSPAEEAGLEVAATVGPAGLLVPGGAACLSVLLPPLWRSGGEEATMAALAGGVLATLMAGRAAASRW